MKTKVHRVERPWGVSTQECMAEFGLPCHECDEKHEVVRARHEADMESQWHEYDFD